MQIILEMYCMFRLLEHDDLDNLQNNYIKNEINIDYMWGKIFNHTTLFSLVQIAYSVYWQ
jgi:hypothetical protein